MHLEGYLRDVFPFFVHKCKGTSFHFRAEIIKISVEDANTFSWTRANSKKKKKFSSQERGLRGCARFF